MSKINEKFWKYMGEQLGWVLGEIRAINLNVARYNPKRGASYINTPSAIAVKKAVLNIQNKDLKCFSSLHIGFKALC